MEVTSNMNVLGRSSRCKGPEARGIFVELQLSPDFKMAVVVRDENGEIIIRV